MERSVCMRASRSCGVRLREMEVGADEGVCWRVIRRVSPTSVMWTGCLARMLCASALLAFSKELRHMLTLSWLRWVRIVEKSWRLESLVGAARVRRRSSGADWMRVKP